MKQESEISALQLHVFREGKYSDMVLNSLQNKTSCEELTQPILRGYSMKNLYPDLEVNRWKEIVS